MGNGLDSRPPGFGDPSDPPEQIIFSGKDLAFELMVTRAILRSLDVDQILYVVLSGVTSGEGLGFNRGVFMLADEGQRFLRTSMAVGPTDKREAHRIWEEMKAKELTLGALLEVYDQVRDDPDAHRLTHRLSELSLPLDSMPDLASEAASPDETGTAPIEPMLAQCLRLKKPLSSTTLKLRYDPPGVTEPFLFSNWWIVPLVTPMQIVGALIVDDAYSSRTVRPRHTHLLLALANLAAIAVEKGRFIDRIRALAEVDGLTGLANRRTYDAEIARQLTNARQTGRAVSLIVIDVDHFKEYNDRLGHLAGDDALRFVARVFNRHARRTDLIARYGGEEFAVILPDTHLEKATFVAEKLVSAVRDESRGETGVGPITVSAGVSSSNGGALDETALFLAADKAVYRAKQAGRDRVVTAQDA